MTMFDHFSRHLAVESYIRTDIKTLTISLPIRKEYVQNIIQCPSKSKSPSHFPCLL